LNSCLSLISPLPSLWHLSSFLAFLPTPAFHTGRGKPCSYIPRGDFRLRTSDFGLPTSDFHLSCQNNFNCPSLYSSCRSQFSFGRSSFRLYFFRAMTNCCRICSDRVPAPFIRLPNSLSFRLPPWHSAIWCSTLSALSGSVFRIQVEKTSPIAPFRRTTVYPTPRAPRSATALTRGSIS